jgi:ABC-type multidrug transport system fused ATPase/permease subunit
LFSVKHCINFVLTAACERVAPLEAIIGHIAWHFISWHFSWMGGLQSVDGGYRVIPGADKVAEKFSKMAEEAKRDNEELLPSVIQFSCAVYYCTESEEKMALEIVRLGDSSREATCDWETRESSAKAGVKYEPTGGHMIFEPGESRKELVVNLLDDDAWDATLEFGVVITGVTGAQPGKYLHSCRIKIIDDDVFPTNKYGEKLRAHNEAGIPGGRLMLEYLRMNFRNTAIRGDSLKQVIIDQSHGVYFILTLYLQMYLVDVVLAPVKHRYNHGGGNANSNSSNSRLLQSVIVSGGEMLARSLGTASDDDTSDQDDLYVSGLLIPGHRRETAMVIGALWILPFAMLHLIDLWKCYLRIPGLARKTLQGNLLRRFLHYREDIHAMRSGDSSDITMAILRDVHEVVDFGYMKVLEVARILGKIGCATMFIVAENKMAVIPLVVYPIILSFYLCCRQERTLAANDQKALKQDKVVQTVSDAINNYRIIADFSLRPIIVDQYEVRIDKFHDRESAACAVIVNNSYVAPWLTTLSIGLYVVFGAYQVKSVGGNLSLGTFLATIHVFKDVGAEMQEIYGEALEIQRAFGPLRKICHFMNLETDLPDRLRINRMRRKHGEEMRQSQRRKRASHSEEQQGKISLEFPVDNVQLEINNLSFQYATNSPLVMHSINITVAQGGLYAFVGPPHEGKSTLMKLLGQVLLPPEGGGYIFIPPHLRVLHVSTASTILKGSLLQNITLDHELDGLGGVERLYKICKRVGFSPDLLRLLGTVDDANDQIVPVPSALDEEDEVPWASRLSDSDHARLTLARVFVMNPECVVYHKPASAFNDYEGKQVVKHIREYVDERGLELPYRLRPYRRPRTLFFTSSTLAGVKEADCVYRVCTEGVYPIESSQVDDRLLH